MNIARVAISIVVLILISSPSFAQKRGGGGREPGALLKSWDKNKDGMLDPSEIPKPARSYVAGSMKANGMDPRKPVKIEQLMSLKKKGADDKAARKLARGAEKLEKAEAKLKKKSGEQPSTEQDSNAKSFGRQTRQLKATGFGAETQEKGAATPELSKKQLAARKRVAFAAKSMMFQHDRNKNGRLDKSEWAALKDNPAASDRNKDGSLSMTELTDHLAGFGSREKDVTVRSRKRKRLAAADNKSGKLSYRFLTPQERLPKGLPVWFIENDGNRDGQLSLREYAGSRMTVAKVDKFAQFDLNGDGLIVAAEYLESLAPE